MTTNTPDELQDLRRQLFDLLGSIMAEPSYRARRILRARLEDTTDRIRALTSGAQPDNEVTNIGNER